MTMGGGNYPRWQGPRFQHRSITPLLGGLLVLSALDNSSYFFPPTDPLYSYYYGLGGYGGGMGNPYGSYGNNYGIWGPWKASPSFTRWPSYQRSSGLCFLAGLTLGGLFGGSGGRRKR